MKESFTPKTAPIAQKGTDKRVDESWRPLGVLRVAKVTYEHTPVHPATDGITLGAMIDEHIANIVVRGELVSEVTLVFETQEQQLELAEIYRRNR